MRLGSWILLAAAVLAAGCRGDDGQEVTVEQLTDLDEDLPDEISRVDLGSLAPADDITFCGAAGRAPARWLTDALVPIQFWVDAYSGVVDAPVEAEAPIASLVDFGEQRLQWHFGQVEDRPEWTAALAEQAALLFDVALDECDDLPMVVNLEGTSDRPSGWADLDDVEIAARCDELSGDLADGVAWFTAETGSPPRHQQEIELVNDLVWQRAIAETGELPDDVPLFTVSDFVGLDRDGAPAPVPGGACDR